jgi:putative ABC transport system permease protein
MARRDLRSGEVRLLLAALALAVAAISSVGFLVERARSGMQRDAAALLGGDALVDSDRAIDPGLENEARAAGLRVANVASFPSMAMSDDPQDGGRLVSVKAVGEGYPLRGELRVRRIADGLEVVASRPGAGEVWVEERLATAPLLHLGRSDFRVTAILVAEPDRSSPWLGFAPRVLVRTEDLAATGLVQPASRIGYRLLLAGERAQLDAFLASLRPRLQRGQRIETAAEGRQDLRTALQRADRFLGLVALLTALTSSVAVALCARRFVERRLDTAALLRCLGATQRRILALFSLDLVLLGLLASATGTAAGFALHFALAGTLAPLQPGEHLPMPGAASILQGLLAGLVLLLAFGLPPLERLRHVPPLRVFRRDIEARRSRAWVTWLPGLLAAGGLLGWAGGDARLALICALGILGCLVLLALPAWILLLLARRTKAGGAGKGLRGLGGQWHFALAGLRRRMPAAVLQSVSLGLGLLALLVLLLVRMDLLREWREQVPADAPNRFALNIQPGQEEAVRAGLARAGVEAALYPMVRGRLVAIDGRPTGPEGYGDEQARSLIEREFNLSWGEALPAGNRIVEGAWFAPGSGGLSIEKGIAERLRIGLGQDLRFDIAGALVDAKVTSIRELQWSSMRVNFFVIMDPALLREAPRTSITAFRLPPGREAAIAAIVREAPNVTVIDIGQVLAQMQSLLGRLADAAQLLFSFAIAAGILVLLASLLASEDARIREAALMRAFGATGAQLARVQAIELGLLGALSGALAALGAALLGWALARWVFEFTFVPRPALLLAAIPAGMLCALAGGRAGLARVLRDPPWRSLRSA